MFFKNAWSSTGDHNAFSFLFFYWKTKIHCLHMRRMLAFYLVKQTILCNQFWTENCGVLWIRQHTDTVQTIIKCLWAWIYYYTIKLICFLFSSQQLKRCLSKCLVFFFPQEMFSINFYEDLLFFVYYNISLFPNFPVFICMHITCTDLTGLRMGRELVVTKGWPGSDQWNSHSFKCHSVKRISSVSDCLFFHLFLSVPKPHSSFVIMVWKGESMEISLQPFVQGEGHPRSSLCWHTLVRQWSIARCVSLASALPQGSPCIPHVYIWHTAFGLTFGLVR